MCGRPCRPSLRLGARLCPAGAWKLPGHPHSLEGLHTCSLGVAGLKPGPVLLLAQALAQAGLSPRLPPVSETLPGPQAGASLSGWDFLCVCAVAAGGAEPTGKQFRWKDGDFPAMLQHVRGCG